MKHENSQTLSAGLEPGGKLLACWKNLVRAWLLALIGLGAFLLPAIGSAQSSDTQVWQEIIKQTQPAQLGCFQASYPSTQWQRVFCAPARSLVPPWRPPVQSANARTMLPAPIGSTGYSAQAVGGPIWAAEGSFLNISGLTSITDSLYNPGGNTYSLQVNTDYFKIPGSSSVCGNPAGCTGWVQFVYGNAGGEHSVYTSNTAYISIWYWVSGARSCPPQWDFVGGWCYYSEATDLSVQPISSFNDQVRLSGQTANGVNTAVITIGGAAYSTNVKNLIPELPQLWQTAHFNVFGIGDRSYVNFNNGASLTLNTKIDNGTTNPPNCSTEVGTGEYNNLYHNSPCCRYGGGKPSIAFVEGTQDNPEQFSCEIAGNNTLGNNTITPEVTPAGGGTITPSVALQVPNRAVSTFTITPDANHRIGSVTGCGGALNGNVFTTAPASAGCAVTATFVSAAQTYTVTASAGAGGTITPTSAQVAAGQTQTFTLHPSSGYQIASVTGCGGALNGNVFSTAPVSAGCAVTATFVSAAQTYTVTASAGAGGTITPPSAQVAAGQTQTFELKPNAGYQTDSVTGCGGSWSGGNAYTTGPVTADCAVSVKFVQAVDRTPSSYTVTAKAIPNGAGTISPAGSVAVNPGTTQVFTITPAANHSLYYVSGNCGGTYRGGTYTTRAVNADCTVTAVFR